VFDLNQDFNHWFESDDLNQSILVRTRGFLEPLEAFLYPAVPQILIDGVKLPNSGIH